MPEFEAKPKYKCNFNPNNFPFGKYKGANVCDIPDNYLDWILNNCDNIDVTLSKAIHNELSRRVKESIEVRDGSDDYYHDGADTSDLPF